MSKTIEEVGLIVGGAALAAVGFVTANPALAGLGISVALGGIGLALRPVNPAIGTANALALNQGPAPRRAIYGQFQTAGVLTYASFTPANNQLATNQYLHLVYTLTGHEITSFDGVVVNGTMHNFGVDLIYSPPATDTLWYIYPASYANDFYWEHMFFEFDFGRPANASQPFPGLAASDPAWTSACLQQGCAKVHVILRYDTGWTAVFQNGQIPNIQFLVTGKKLIDTRIQTAWQPSTGYVKDQWAIDSFAANPSGLLWVQTNASGTSGAGPSSPLVYVSNPTTVTDGSCSWTCYGESPLAAEAGISSSPQGNLVGDRLMNDAWAPGYTAWAVGFIIEAPLGYYQMVTASGTSGASEPNWSLTRGGTTTDNTYSWVCLGRSRHALNPANPALCVNDYLQDTDAGMGAKLATIDTSSVSAAANVCEEQALIIWNADNSVVYENLYSCNGMFDHSSNRGDVLDSLCASMAGWVIPPGDLWHVFAGSYQTPTVALGDTDMRGPVKGDFRLSLRDVCNTVKARFVPAFLPTNPSAAFSLTQVPGTWQAQSAPEYQANGMAGKPNYLNTEDGGQILRLNLTLDFTTSLWTAQRLAKIALMRTRFQQTLTLPCKIIALQLEAGDTFAWTHLRWNILAQTFEIVQMAVTFDAGGAGGGAAAGNDAPVLGVDIVARQVDPSIYEFTGPSSASNFGEYSPYGVTGVMTGVE